MPNDRCVEPPPQSGPLLTRPFRAWLIQESADPTGRLSLAIAHEIRQALTAISFTGEALRLLHAPLAGSRPEYGTMLDEIVETSQHAAAVVQRFDTLTRVETIAALDVDLNRLVRVELGLSQ